MREFDPCAFEERAAITEYCGNATRFEAETLAAQQQGVTRWQALKAIKDATDANGSRHSQGSRNTDAAMAGGSRQDNMPGMQCGTEEENRSVSVDQQAIGRDSLVLSALRTQGRPAV